jgi:hypothetical protein
MQSMITETRLKLNDFKALRAEERAQEILSDASPFHAKKR